jgi:hypothetical protein
MLIMITATTFAQTDIKRSRGEGMYKCENANTVGSGETWLLFRALGFLWDSDPLQENFPEPFAFPEIRTEIGLFDFASVQFESRLLSYGWQFDWAALGTKFTFLKNNDLRFQNAGLKLEYKHRFLPVFRSSIAGFQNSAGSGFTPEGFIVHGANLTVLALYDLDFIAKFSWLPLKFSVNTGVRIPFEKEFTDYSQYLVTCGIAYLGLGADVFIEYSLEAFANSSSEPKIFSFNWSGWGTTTKKWEVAFPENPMYLTVGGRVRYPSGLTLFGAIPLLVSKNQGSTTAHSGRTIEHNFPDEAARGITDGFDPWYAKWKIILEISYPIRFKQTGAEMRRGFLLLKNKKGKKTIDIDKRISVEEDTSDVQNEEKADRKKRLDEIDKKRKEIERSK